MRQIHGCGEGDIPGGEPPSGLQPHLAGLEILAPAADIGADPGTLYHRHCVAVPLRVFLNDDGVGPLGHRAAGEDTHRLAGRDLTFVGASRGGFARY